MPHWCLRQCVCQFSRGHLLRGSIRLQSTGGRIDKLNISSADLRRSWLNVLQDSQSFAQGLAEFEQHVQDALLHDGCVWRCMVLLCFVVSSRPFQTVFWL